MRPIKFRQPVVLSNGHLERWHYWGFYEEQQFIGPLPIFTIPNFEFTGLLDKNGKEIYEGDIIRCRAYQREQTVIGEYEPEIVKVSYGDGYFYPFGYNAGWRSGVEDVEVIGNIYENPELLIK